MLMRLLIFAISLASLQLLGPAPAAFADGDCPDGQTPTQTETGVICVVVADPGTPETPGTPGEQSGGGNHQVGCFKNDGTQVPCATDLGVWWSGHQCYAQPSDAPPGSPAWQGHSDGTLWMCTSCVEFGNTSTCRAQAVWLAPGLEPGPPDPGQLAAVAVGVMHLATAEVNTAPQPPDHTYIGIENWLWLPQAQWVTLSKTVTAGGTSVTVTAAPSRVLWDMGPTTKTCYASGTEWQVGMTDAAHTNCGYTYAMTSGDEPDGQFSIAATIRYQVDWTCTGACTVNSGTLGLVDAPAGSGSMRVLQRQTVVVR